MDSKLEQKLLLKKAEKYVSQLSGIESFKFAYINETGFIWHKEQIALVNKIDRGIEGVIFSHPINSDLLIDVIANILNKRSSLECSCFFEGGILITFNMSKLDLFLNGMFNANNTYDLSLCFLHPDELIVISDDEYDVNLFHITK